MSTYAPPSDALTTTSGWADGARRALGRVTLRRGAVFGLILAGALIAFEFFNYGTTEFALRDLMGNLTFGPVSWSVVLALAFCGMDFAGIARLLTPERSDRGPSESWYLLGAWAVAASMNAMLTWWAVSLAVLSHPSLGNEIIGREQLVRSAPAFVALLVVLVRVLIIGAFTLSGTRIFSQGEGRTQLLLRPLGPRSSRSHPAAPRPSFPKPARRDPLGAPSPAFARTTDHHDS